MTDVSKLDGASVDSLLILSKFDELIAEIRGLRDDLKDFKAQQAAAAAAEAAKDSGSRKVSPCSEPVTRTTLASGTLRCGAGATLRRAGARCADCASPEYLALGPSGLRPSS